MRPAGRAFDGWQLPKEGGALSQTELACPALPCPASSGPLTKEPAWVLAAGCRSVQRRVQPEHHQACVELFRFAGTGQGQQEVPEGRA